MTPPLRPVTPIGLLAARLDRTLELAEQLEGPTPLLNRLLDELRTAGRLAGGLEAYVEAMTTPESTSLAALAARTVEHDWIARNQRATDSPVALLEAEMLSGHVEGQLLKFLVAMTGARRVLEVGMFTGYSALALAEAVGPAGRVVACELDPGVAALAEAGFAAAPAGSRIDVRVGPADATLASLTADGERFDLIFIDADKPGYLGYVDAILNGALLEAGGTIAVDNTLLQGEPWLEPHERSANGEAIHAFNAAIAADPRVEQVLVPLRDGVTLIRRAAT